MRNFKLLKKILVDFNALTVEPKLEPFTFQGGGAGATENRAAPKHCTFLIKDILNSYSPYQNIYMNKVKMRSMGDLAP